MDYGTGHLNVGLNAAAAFVLRFLPHDGAAMNALCTVLAKVGMWKQFREIYEGFRIRILVAQLQ